METTELNKSIENVINDLRTHAKNNYPHREQSLKRSALFYHCLGLTFIVTGIVLLFMYTINESNKLNVKNSYTEKSNKSVSPHHYEVHNITSKEDYQISWSNILYFSVKSILIITLLITAAKYSFNTAKTFTNELLKIANRKQTVPWGIFYLLLINESKNPVALVQALNNCNLNSIENAFYKSNQFDSKHLDRALELICKVKSVVNSENKATSS